MTTTLPQSEALAMDAGPWRLDAQRTPDRLEAFSTWMADPVVARSLGRRAGPMPMQQVQAIMDQHDGRSAWVLFASVPKTGQTIGYVSIMIAPNGVARLDAILGDRTVHGNAFMGHVVTRVMDWLFTDRHVRKTVVHVLASNRASNAFISNLLFREGVLREETLLPDGTSTDQHRYSVLAHEWEGVRAKAYGARDAGSRQWSNLGGTWE